MNKDQKDFIKRLVSMKTKAEKEKTCLKTIYNRVKKGVYPIVKIDGFIFIIEDYGA